MHDKTHGKFFLATPDLYLSDTEINSPDGGLIPERSHLERNPSNDTIIVPSRHNRSVSGCRTVTDPVSKFNHDGGNLAALDHRLHSLNSHSKDVLSEKLKKLQEGRSENQPSHTTDNGLQSTSECRTLSDVDKPVSVGVQKLEQSSGSVPRPGRSSYDANQNVPPSRQERSEEQRIKQEKMKESRRRDSSPIDRLADMFKNLTKF